MGFLELRRPWGFSPEARRGSQGASRAAPGKSGLHARGEGERVLALESRDDFYFFEFTNASFMAQDVIYPGEGSMCA